MWQNRTCLATSVSSILCCWYVVDHKKYDSLRQAVSWNIAQLGVNFPKVTVNINVILFRQYHRSTYLSVSCASERLYVRSFPGNLSKFVRHGCRFALSSRLYKWFCFEKKRYFVYNKMTKLVLICYFSTWQSCGIIVTPNYLRLLNQRIFPYLTIHPILFNFAHCPQLVNVFS